MSSALRHVAASMPNAGIDMFGSSGSAKRREMISTLASSLAGGIGTMHDVEKATILMLTKSMLLVAARMTGSPLASDPTVNAAEAEKAIKGLIAHRDRLAAILAEDDVPNKRHASVHLRSAELAVLTLGVALVPEAKSGCKNAWLAAWKGRTRLQDAVTWVRRYEASTGVQAFPAPNPAKAPNDLDLLKIGGSAVPNFLRPKK